jgi:hypothetical protein
VRPLPVDAWWRQRFGPHQYFIRIAVVKSLMRVDKNNST